MQPQTSSAQSSPTSGTGASKNNAFRREIAGDETGSEKTRSAEAGALTPKGVTLAEGESILRACNTLVEEISATRRLVGALERENELLKERFDTEKRATSLLTELSESRRAENEALRNAIAAKNETVVAKNAVIASQEKLIEALQKRKSSPWRRLGDVLIGVAAGAIFR